LLRRSESGLSPELLFDGVVLLVSIRALSKSLLRMSRRAAQISLLALQEARVRAARKAIQDHRHLLRK
jgi:hypothetical protein